MEFGVSVMANDVDEAKMYVFVYLTGGRYPDGATKVQKGVIRKQSKTYKIEAGVLHYCKILYKYWGSQSLTGLMISTVIVRLAVFVWCTCLQSIAFFLEGRD